MSATDTRVCLRVTQQMTPAAPNHVIQDPRDLARAFADLYAEHMESPWAFFYFGFLTWFGALCSGLVTLDSELDIQPRLYVVLLGASADPRKSTALKKCDQFFSELRAESPELIDCATLYGVGSAEGLGKALTKTSRCVLVYDELKSFVNVAQRDGSVLLPMVNTLYDSMTYGNETKHLSLKVTDAQLALAAACTADTYGTMFSTQFMAIGFPNRLWLVPGEGHHSVPFPTPVDADRKRALMGQVRDAWGRIYTMSKREGCRPIRYPMSPEALRLWTEWYEANRRNGGIFARRLDVYGLRLCLLLTAVRGLTQVEPDVVTDAVQLLEWQREARQDHDPIDADSRIAALEEKIRRVVARGPVSLREVQQRTNASRAGLWAFTAALNNNLTARLITRDPKTGLYGPGEEA